MYQSLTHYLKDKSILIVGFGREGKSTFSFLRESFPKKFIAIADARDITLPDDDTSLIVGKDYLSHINEYDIVIKSPGVSFKAVEINSKTEVTCQIDLFLRFIDVPCIGVTGTKGKTTTSTLIYLMLSEAGIKTALIGNIGIPVFEQFGSLDGVTPVIEMSSHQLEFTSASPHIALLTNVYPEHLDHYKGFDQYVLAKGNIAFHQTESDFFLYGKRDGLPEQFSGHTLNGKQITVRVEEAKDNPFLKKLIKASDLLKGKHNQFDVLMAYHAAKLVGADDTSILRATEKYKGIPHRMELVGMYRGITFYNDSIATIPQAVMAAVDALENVETLIIGGMDRGLDYSKFVYQLADSNVKNVICLPETGHAIGQKLISEKASQLVLMADDMEHAVTFAFMNTHAGNVCLFSPAASSYNVYRNFEEKGNHFKKLVMENGK